jgi:hypothetical protein
MTFRRLEVDATGRAGEAPAAWLLHSNGSRSQAPPAVEHRLALVGRHRHEMCQELFELGVLVHIPLERRRPPV